MDWDLLEIAAEIAKHLRARNETVAVAESSAGGLIAAALLAVPGASAYFQGGAVAYTGAAKDCLVGVTAEDTARARAATEEHALVMARRVRDRFGATWGIGETGAAGPSGNRYGDPPGHACVAVAGPVERAATVATGADDRVGNMTAFALAALRLFRDNLATTASP